MTNLIDLPKHEAFTFFNKYNIYKSSSDKKRAEAFLDLLMYSYEKLGFQMTMTIIQKETKDDRMNQITLMGIVVAKSNK